MSDSLIRDIQSEAIEGKVDYARLLRKAKIAAVKLSQPTAITWIDSEINGYRCLYEELPKYRQAKGELKAINPYHGLIPFMVNNHELHETFTNAPIAGGVGTLAALLTEDRDQLQ